MKLKIDLPRGFLVSNSAFAGSIEFGGAYLATHELTQVYTAERDGIAVILIGHAVDIHHQEAGEQTIVERLVSCRSVEEMADETRDVLGRFAVIGRIDDRWFAFHDAGALRTIYYACGAQWFLSSHSILIADQTRAIREEAIFRHFRGGLPGNRSPFPGIRLLPANCYVRPETGELVRHWPRVDRVEAAIDEAQRTFNDNLALAAKAITRSKKPIIGVTAGLDSRLSVALLRGVQGARFFSHSAKVNETKVDVSVAAEVCRVSGVEHEVIQLEHTPHPLDGRLVDYKHNNAVWRTYARQLNASDFIYVRSVLPEVGMRFWLTNGVRSLSPRVGSNLIRNKTMAGEDGHENARDFATGEFEALIGALGYSSDRTLRGYDRMDLYYLEHRLATWHGPILLGLDTAFETNIVFNTRHILETMLSVSDDHRVRKTLFMEALRHFAPDLALIPINPHKL